jgi:hypothetical protein
MQIPLHIWFIHFYGFFMLLLLYNVRNLPLLYTAASQFVGTAVVGRPTTTLGPGRVI